MVYVYECEKCKSKYPKESLIVSKKGPICVICNNILKKIHIKK